MILERSFDPKHGYGVPYNYPIVVPLVNALFYLFIFIPLYMLLYLSLHFGDIANLLGTSDIGRLADIIEQNVLGSQRINVVFWARYLTALFGTSVVVIGYLVGRRLFNSKAVGLLASLFIAINYRQVLNSHIGIPDIYNAALLLFAIYQIIELWEKPSLMRYTWAGVSVALFFSTKFQFFAFPPLALILIFLAWKKKGLKERVMFFFQKNIFLMVGVMVIAAVVLNIFHIIHIKDTLEQVGYSALKYRYGKSTLDFYPISYLYHIGIGPVMSFVAVLGIVLGLISRFRQMLLLLSVIIPFMWMFVYYTGGGFYTRNFVTITPLILICAGFGVYASLIKLKHISRFLSFIIGLTLILVLSYESLSNSLIVPAEYLKTWNFKLAQNWLGKNLPERSTILAYPYAPLPTKNLKVIEVKSPADYSLAEMQDQGIEWAFINTEWMSDSFFWWMNQDTLTSLRFWQKPTTVLSNTPLSRSILELKKFIMFEALNPWQAPDNNFLVIKVPEKIKFEGGKLIYEDDFTSPGWKVVNDGFGEITNFSQDPLIGNTNPGSLKIAQSSLPLYSQRFLSDKIPVAEGKVYKVKGLIHSSSSLPWDKRDGFLGVDFLSDDDEILGTALSARVYGSDKWIEREFITKLPERTKSIRFTFQVGVFNQANFWLDDVELWESMDKYIPSESRYIKSNFDLDKHLLLNSNGGM